MAAIHKKHTEHKTEEPAVISDIVTETTERIEVIEKVAPEPKLEAKTSEESASAADPLTDFKEKMTEEEESPISGETAKKNFMWPILFVFIVALLLLGGIFAYKNNTKGEKINVVTLSITPTIIPEPTKTIVLTKYEIKILNGSGVAGEAGRQKSSLETEGFVISSTGNADNSNYTDTIIKAKEKVDKAFLDKLKSILGSTFTFGEVEVLSEDSSVPVVVIIGTKK